LSQNWLRVFSCSTFRSAFSKFLLLFVVWLSVLLLLWSSFLMTDNPFYVFFFRNDWVDVWCCSFHSFRFTVLTLLRASILHCRRLLSYAVRVVSKESRWSALPRTSYYICFPLDSYLSPVLSNLTCDGFILGEYYIAKLATVHFNLYINYVDVIWLCVSAFVFSRTKHFRVGTWDLTIRIYNMTITRY
jgi:hypothetical protein